MGMEQKIHLDPLSSRPTVSITAFCSCPKPATTQSDLPPISLWDQGPRTAWSSWEPLVFLTGSHWGKR